jgi:regulatory protein
MARIENDADAPRKKRLTPTEALARAYRYCAYQERSHQEVKNKLYSFGLYTDEVDELVARLITEGFLNEERFAKAYAGGKFRIKKWGRVKIENELNSLGLSKNCISRGMKEIANDDYENTLRHLLEKKEQSTDEANVFRKRDKLAKYAISRGYEPELVWKTVKALLP